VPRKSKSRAEGEGEGASKSELNQSMNERASTGPHLMLQHEARSSRRRTNLRVFALWSVRAGWTSV
jgi:hypothetical protein